MKFLNFLKSAIEKRESAKFEFTRNLSDALSLISDLGDEMGLSRNDLSYCEFTSFKDFIRPRLRRKELIIESVARKNKVSRNFRAFVASFDY